MNKKDKEEKSNGLEDSQSELQDTSIIGEFLWKDEDDGDRQDTQGPLEEPNSSIKTHEPPHNDHMETILRLVEERHDKQSERFKAGIITSDTKQNQNYILNRTYTITDLKKDTNQLQY